MDLTSHTATGRDGLPVPGFVTPDGLFLTQRPDAGWLWDVWASPEAVALPSHAERSALVRGNLRSLDEAAAAARDAST